MSTTVTPRQETSDAKAGTATALGVEIFRAGTFRDSKKRERTWTVDHLKEIADSYNSIVGYHDAPIQIGHDGNTAYGWVKRAYVEGDRLLGDFSDADPNFAVAVNNRVFRKRSISIYPPDHEDNPTPGRFNMRHVAFVGVPSCKGMKDFKFEFSEPEGVELYEFSADGSEPLEYGLTEMAAMALATIFQNQRDQLIAAKGVEAADKVFPTYLLDDIRRASESGSSWMEDTIFSLLQRVSDLEARSGVAYPSYEEARMTTDNTPNPTPSPAPASAPAVDFSEFTSRLDALTTTVSQLQAANTAKDEQIAALVRINQGYQTATERRGIADFVEGLISERKLLPQDKERTINILMRADNSIPDTSDHAEGSAAPLSLRQELMAQYSDRRPMWSATPLGTDPANAPDLTEYEAARLADYSLDSVDDDRRIRRKCQEMGLNPNNTSDYASAMDALGITY